MACNGLGEVRSLEAKERQTLIGYSALLLAALPMLWASLYWSVRFCGLRGEGMYQRSGVMSLDRCKSCQLAHSLTSGRKVRLASNLFAAWDPVFLETYVE